MNLDAVQRVDVGRSQVWLRLKVYSSPIAKAWVVTFDGDEMNLHAPQSEEAAVELEEIASIPQNIVTPRHAKPLIGVFQDTLVGSYRLTRPGIEFNQREFMNLMMTNKRFDGEIPQPAASNNTRYTGQQVLSQLLPPINMGMGNNSFNSDKEDKTSNNFVKIVQGNIEQGIVDSSIYMKPGKGIIHVTYNDYGPQHTVDLLDSLQTTVENFLVMNGFSIGISDLVADEDTKVKIQEAIQLRKKQVEQVILQVHTDLFDNNTGKTNQQEFEDQVFGILNQAASDAGKSAQGSLSDENRLVAMVKSGSKGEVINIAQMIACLGQTALEGKRIPYGYTDRTLPHFKKYDDSAEARGFVESSFIRGLTPQEFYFHAMSGREGLIDTAVKTAETGYIQRQLIKAMEDIVVQHDGTVRDAKMNVVQYYYGEDSIMATKLEGQSLPLSKLSHAEIKREFGMEAVDWAAVLEDGTSRDDDSALIQAYVEDVIADQVMMVEGVYQGAALDADSVNAPVNLARMILNITTRFGIKKTEKTNLTPAYVLEGMNKIVQHTRSEHNKIWKALLHYHLAPHRLIVDQRMTTVAFDMLCELIVVNHMKSWVQPGEQVGVVAAQSIGEPATQMSSVGSTVICVTDGAGGRFYGSIKDFIDPILAKNLDKVTQIAEDSIVFAPEKTYYIVGVSEDEKTSWRKISEISRHPANGGLVEVVTRSGRKTTATLSHSFLKRAPTGIVPVLGSDLKVGMRIPIARVIPTVPGALTSITQGATTFALTKAFGWVCGIYLADGCMRGNVVSICKIHPTVEDRLAQFTNQYGFEFKIKNYNGEFGPGKDNNIYSKDLKDLLVSGFKEGSYIKEVAPFVFHSNAEFIAGVISGYFDGDGNVNIDRQQIRVGSRSKKLIEQMAALLGYCGIFGVVGEETTKHISDKVMYTLNVLKKFATQFKRTIGFNLQEKAAGLDAVIEYMERDDKHNTQEMFDKIPELGHIIAETGKLLRMPGQSRTYGRWTKKESVGRLTLQQYIGDFEEMIAVHVDEGSKAIISNNMRILKSAANADVIWDEIVELNYKPDPKEYVYDFTVPGNDSFMVDNNVLVHNTLNSVDWDEKIIIAKNGTIMTPMIGEFIDNYYKECENTSVIQHLANDQVYIELKDGHDWKALSCDENGTMMWTKLEAITRHPVINEDGTNTILEVELESGRKVKATKAHSFLTYKDGKVVHTKGSELTIGDKMPISMDLKLDGITHITELSLRPILSAKEYLYGYDINKALEVMKRENEAGNRHWFSAFHGKEFTIPYSRSDAFREAFVNGYNGRALTYRSDCVYTKPKGVTCSHIPASIPLTDEFGFFVGAYLAEGMSNTTQVNITNNDTAYINRIKSLMDSWSVGYHVAEADKIIENTGITGKTTSLVIHSTILAKVMSETFGRLSYTKHIPDWVLQAPDVFVHGLMDGYISGDGCVSLQQTVSVTSVSEQLINVFSTLLLRYGIFSTISSRMPKIKKFKSVSRHYTLYIPKKFSALFAKQFTMTIVKKQERLNMIKAPSKKCKWAELNDVILDKVKNIKETAPMKGSVYDLTVEKTRNFTVVNGICLADTFHQAGVASKSAVTRGVPRLRELLKITKNPKATSLTIYLKPEYRQNKEKAREVVQDLELTLLRNITDKVAIYWDPTDESSVVDEDRKLIEFYRMLEMTELGDASADLMSKWILRLELNREEMFNKNISMADVAFVIKNIYSDTQIVYNDYNSDNLVMRIRLPKEKDSSTASELDDFTVLKKFQNKLLNNTVIRGIPGIKAVTFRMDKQRVHMVDRKYEPLEQYILDTDGSNFVKVANHPAIDATRLYTTNVHDVMDILGLEAVRAILMSELNALFDAVGVNYRHLGILCDWMTRTGRLMSADRYGINKNDIGPIAKMSFEETERITLKASLFGEVDPVTGVSANVMTGQPFRGGTAFSQILLDEAALKTLYEQVPEDEDAEGEEEQDGDISELISESIQAADPCATAQFQMNMSMPPTVNKLIEPDIAIDIIEEQDEE